ncbi:MAG: alpha/beta fold hydrolase [Nitrospiraceae bacterium]
MRFPICGRLLHTVTPLAVRQFECRGEERGRRLIVLLPGIDDTKEDYEFHGFAEPVQRRGLSVDLVAVDAHYGYYANRTVLERLKHDVIAPARDKGYREIWLAGISLGGLGALLYAREHPGDIAGIVALAPFLGDSRIIEEISGAGGVRQWLSGDPIKNDYQRSLWAWLKRYEHPAPGLPDLYLAYGDRDKFAHGHRLLSELLPLDHVLQTRGTHNWTTWKRLWEQFLARRSF